MVDGNEKRQPCVGCPGYLGFDSLLVAVAVEQVEEEYDHLSNRAENKHEDAARPVEKFEQGSDEDDYSAANIECGHEFVVAFAWNGLV